MKDNLQCLAKLKELQAMIQANAFEDFGQPYPILTTTQQQCNNILVMKNESN